MWSYVVCHGFLVTLPSRLRKNDSQDMNKFAKTIPFLALLGMASFTHAEDKEQPLTLEQVPAAVAATIKKAIGGEKLHKLEKENEEGAVAYEAKWSSQGKKHEILVAEDGAVLSEELVIELTEAPQAVQDAINKEAAGGKVTKVEKEVAKGVTTYEAEIKTAKGETELKLDANGKVLKAEKEEKEDDKGEL